MYCREGDVPAFMGWNQVRILADKSVSSEFLRDAVTLNILFIGISTRDPDVTEESFRTGKKLRNT